MELGKSDIGVEEFEWEIKFHVAEQVGQCLSQDSLMRSYQGNFHIFVKCKQLILIDIISKRRRHV